MTLRYDVIRIIQKEGVEFMAEKVTSMRLGEEDLEIFKEFAKENGLNQQQAFNTLIALAELEKAKNAVGDRAKSIDAFRETINRAIGMYINSLEENTTAEQAIRAELSKELQTKDNTIGMLQGQLQKSEDEKKELERLYKNYQLSDSMLREKIEDLNAEVANKQKSIDNLNGNNDLLQEQLKEYKEYRNINKQLQQELEQLKAEINNKDNVINTLDNSNKQLNDKIKNDSEMLEFYKSNNEELKVSVRAIEDRYNNQIQEIKTGHENALQEQIKAITENLNNKHEVEIAKKDLEMQKLQNEMDQLKNKINKPATNKNK